MQTMMCNIGRLGSRLNIVFDPVNYRNLFVVRRRTLLSDATSRIAAGRAQASQARR